MDRRPPGGVPRQRTGPARSARRGRRSHAEGQSRTGPARPHAQGQDRGDTEAMRCITGLLLVYALAAQGVRKGEVIDRVDVPGHPGQTYALYLPSNYTPDREWPVLYCLDPGARGKTPVDRFAAAAEKAG